MHSTRFPSPGEDAVAVVGGGPAGLMAAEVLAAGGAHVELFDAMPSVGRKLLLAGVGGLNLTHGEPRHDFLSRFGARRDRLEPLLTEFGAEELRDWARTLGIETFVGSSSRVFPVGMKAAPLLRAWLHRLREAGVRIHVRHRWLGWDDDRPAAYPPPLRIASPEREFVFAARAVVFALGGASRGRFGSDGAWVPLFQRRGVPIAPLKPANCGFDVGTTTGRESSRGWSAHFRDRFAGQPLKTVSISYEGNDGGRHTRQGECTVTASGLEGSLIYALSAALRDRIAERGSVTLYLDLVPGRSQERLTEDLARPRGSRSMASHLQSKAGITGVKAGLLRECTPADVFAAPARLAAAIKALPLELVATRPIEEAISTAGGVPFEALDERLMLDALPGTFCAGEMLDWEAPTGGYLLTACLATGRAAGLGALGWIAQEG